MNGNDRQALELRSLREEIGQVGSVITANVDRCEELLNKLVGAERPPSDEVKQALAAYLHHFYTGVETVLSRVAEQFNGGVPRTSDWHLRLLQKMSRPLPDIRPALISKETQIALDPFRGFRHVFRHGYGVELDWKRLRELVEAMPATWRTARGDLEAFMEFIDRSIEALETSEDEA